MSFDLALGFTGGLPHTEQPLTRHDLETAHEAATEAVAVLCPVERTVWRAQMIALAFAGVTPLLGYAVFGWPTYWIVLALLLDDAALLCADIVKMLFAERAFCKEIERRRVVADVLAVARAFSWSRSRDDQDVALVRRVHPRSSNAMGSVLLPYALFGFAIVAPSLFFMWLFAFVNGNDAAPQSDGWWLLLLPAVTRIVPAVRIVRRARGRPRPRPELMPQAWASISATLLTITAFFSILLAVFGNHGYPPFDRHMGLYFFALFLVASALIALALWRLLLRREGELRRFATSDVGELVERLHRAKQVTISPPGGKGI